MTLLLNMSTSDEDSIVSAWLTMTLESTVMMVSDAIDAAINATRTPLMTVVESEAAAKDPTPMRCADTAALDADVAAADPIAYRNPDAETELLDAIAAWPSFSLWPDADALDAEEIANDASLTTFAFAAAVLAATASTCPKAKRMPAALALLVLVTAKAPSVMPKL